MPGHHRHKLEFHQLSPKFVGVYCSHPLTWAHLRHGCAALHAPCAQCLVGTSEHEPLVAKQLRCSHFHHHASAGSCSKFSIAVSRHALCERKRILIRFCRAVYPPVAHVISRHTVVSKIHPMFHKSPLAACLMSAALHAVVVAKAAAAASLCRHRAAPHHVVVTVHHMPSSSILTVFHIHHESFSCRSAIFYAKCYLHRFVF